MRYLNLVAGSLIVMCTVGSADAQECFEERCVHEPFHALEDNVAISFYNVGIDYYVTHDFVIDFRVGVGLTKDSDDFFAGAGGGYRF